MAVLVLELGQPSMFVDHASGLSIDPLLHKVVGFALRDLHKFDLQGLGVVLPSSTRRNLWMQSSPSAISSSYEQRTRFARPVMDEAS